MTRSRAPHHHFLAQGFSGFLRRRTLKHFARCPLLDTLAGRGPTQAAPSKWHATCCGSHATNPRKRIARLKSYADGLSAREAARAWPALARIGPNEVE